MRGGALLLGLLFLVDARGQGPSGTVAGGWELPILEEGRLSTLLTGQEAEIREGAPARISQAALQFFQPDSPESPYLRIEAPECYFEPRGRTVYSPGPLSLRESGGRYTVEGKGFLWDPGPSTLYISNEVRTVWGRPGPGEEEASIGIRSGTFRFHRGSGSGIYSRDVRAERGEALRMECRELEFQLDREQSGDQLLTARGEVRIQLQPDILLRCGQASYRSDAQGRQSLSLSGDPSWESPEASGRGEAIEASGLEASPLFSVTGQARMEAAAPGSHGGRIRIRSESYQLAGSRAGFRGGVQAEGEGIALRSRELDAFLDPGGQGLERIHARGDARAEIGGGDSLLRLSGREMVLEPGEPDRIRFEGRAVAETEGRTARGEAISIEMAEGGYRVRIEDGAEVLLPPSALPQGLLPGLASPPGEALDRELRIVSREASLQPERARFDGDVSAFHLGGSLACGSLVLDLGEEGRSLDRLEALEGVRLEQGGGLILCHRLEGRFAEGGGRLESLEATGGSASGEDASVRLPLATARGSGAVHTTARALLWNPSAQAFEARGPYLSRFLPSDP